MPATWQWALGSASDVRTQLRIRGGSQKTAAAEKNTAAAEKNTAAAEKNDCCRKNSRKVKYINDCNVLYPHIGGQRSSTLRQII